MPRSRQSRTSVIVLILVALLSSNLAQTRPPLADAAPARQIAMGVSMRPDRNPGELDKFVASTGGRMPAIVSLWSDWGGSTAPFPAWMAGELAKRKAIPMIFWQPVNSSNLGSPAFTYSSMLAGDHDAYIRQWAKDAKAFGGDVIVRFAHEMDGYWFPWGMGRFDNTPARFIAAWRYVVEMVRTEIGATNVKFLWSPYTPKGSVYPGDAHVDFVGFSRFNWGSVHDAPWQTMESLFADPVQRATNITSKPIIVAETASTSIAGDKANWITKGYQAVYDAYPSIKAIVYFSVNTLPGQVDWRLNTPPAALAAYAGIAADPRFQGTIGKPGAPPPPTNRPPSATVALSPANPTTDQTLTATVTASDPDGDTINLDYVWKVNGAVKRTLTTTARTDTFNLATAGNGDPGQTVSVAVTPRDATLAGPIATKSVTVATPGGGPVTYVNDTFNRNLSDTWGAITTGGPYTLEGKIATYDVAAGVGTMSLGAGVTRSAVLGTVLARDVDMTFRVATDKVSVGGAQFAYGIARSLNSSNRYLVKVRMPKTGGVYLQAVALVNNVETTIGSEFLVPGLAHTAGGFIRVHAQVTGANPTTIRMRAWADGTAEPANWQYSVTNSAAALQVAGAVGLRAYVASTTTNAPVLFSFDDFLVATPGALPPPPSNRPPTASVVLNPANPTTDQTLTATVTASDPDGDTVNLDYVWKVNGAVKRTLTTTARTDTFSLAPAGNGDPGQTISVEVTPRDAALAGTKVTKSVTVATAGGAVTYASDLFDRTATDKWGSAAKGGLYTVSTQAGNYDVGSGVGAMTLAAGANRSAILKDVSGRDVDITFRVATDKVAAGDLQFVYALARVVGSNEYRVKLRLPADRTVLLQASLVTAGGETPLSNAVTVPGLTHAAARFIRVHAQVTGANPTTIRIRAWADGTAEPSNWQYSVTNSAAGLQGAGAVGLRSYLGSATSNGPVVFSFDDLRVTSVGAPPANRAPSATVVLSPATPTTDQTLTASVTASDPDGDTINLDYVWKVNGAVKRTVTTTARTDSFNLALAGNGDPGQIVTVEVTPRDAALAGATATRSATVAGPGGPIFYAEDQFNRTVSDKWGSAETGGSYLLTGSASDYDVSGGFGTMLLSATANRAAVLGGVSAKDVQLKFRVATDKLAAGDMQFVYALARVTGTSEYRAKLRLAPDGSVSVQASSVIAGTETRIGNAATVPGLRHTPGSFIWVRAQITGSNPTTIRMRAWAAGTAEPTTWHLTVTNSAAGLQQAGAVGLRAYLPAATTSGPVLFRFDDIRISSVAAP